MLSQAPGRLGRIFNTCGLAAQRAIMTPASQGSAELEFVKNTPSLRQAAARFPSDGFFPKEKSIEAVAVTDLDKVSTEKLEQIIRKRQSMETRFVDGLLWRIIEERKDEVVKFTSLLYERLRKERADAQENESTTEEPSQNSVKPISHLSNVQYNLMVASAAAFSDQVLFDQLMLESSVLGVPLDTQTYIKALSEMNDADCRRDYLETVMQADLTPADSHFAKDIAHQLAFQRQGPKPDRENQQETPTRKIVTEISDLPTSREKPTLTPRDIVLGAAVSEPPGTTTLQSKNRAPSARISSDSLAQFGTKPISASAASSSKPSGIKPAIKPTGAAAKPSTKETHALEGCSVDMMAAVTITDIDDDDEAEDVCAETSFRRLVQAIADEIEETNIPRQ